MDATGPQVNIVFKVSVLLIILVLDVVLMVSNLCFSV